MKGWLLFNRLCAFGFAGTDLVLISQFLAEPRADQIGMLLMIGCLPVMVGLGVCFHLFADFGGGPTLLRRSILLVGAGFQTLNLFAIDHLFTGFIPSSSRFFVVGIFIGLGFVTALIFFASKET